MGRPHLDAHEIGRDPLLQHIESPGVEGVIDLQCDARDPLLAGDRGQRRELVGRTGERRRLRTVVSCDIDRVRLRPIDQVLRGFGVRRDHEHAALAAQTFLILAAQMQDAQGVSPREEAAAFRRGDLADAVPEHGSGMEAIALEHRCQRRLDGEQQRLRPRGHVQDIARNAALQVRRNGPSCDVAVERIDFVDLATKGGVRPVGELAHLRILGAIAAEDENRLAVIERRHRSRRLPCLDAAIRVRLQRRDHGWGVVGAFGKRQGQPMGENLLLVDQRGRNLGDGCALDQCLGDLLASPAQRFGRGSRYQQDLRRPGARRSAVAGFAPTTCGFGAPRRMTCALVPPNP